jgi:hypothetical protein
VTALAALVFSLFVSEPSRSAILIADLIDPQTPEEAIAEGQYLRGFIRKEKSVLGEESPVFSCNTLHMILEMRTWRYPSGLNENELLLMASRAPGGCADEAAQELAASLTACEGGCDHM